MSYQGSYFNFLIPVEEKKEYLLYNSLMGGLVVLDESEGNYLSQIMEKKEFKFNEISALKRKFIKELIDLNFIIDSADEERDLLSLSHMNFVKDRIEAGIFGLTIVPTLDCNLACRYCFQNPSMGRIMREETFAEVVRFVKEEIEHPRIFPKYKMLNITWFGGEPLLEIKSIKKYASALYEMAAERGIEYKSFLVTNGTLLGEEAFGDLRDCFIRELLVTMDGPKQIHDINRPFKKGNSSSYEKIIGNVKKLPEDFKLTIRINCSKMVWENIEALFDDLEKCELWPQRYFQVSIDIAYISSYGNARYDDKESYYSWRELVKVQRQFNEFKLARFNRWAEKNDKESATFRFDMPKRSWHRCGSANSPAFFVIDPEGYFCKCWEDVDKPEHRIQHVSTPFDENNIKLRRWLNADKVYPKEICRDCKVLPICDTNCAKTVLDDPKNFRCSPWKVKLEEELKKQYIMSSDEP